jgi:hemoglobin
MSDASNAGTNQESLYARLGPEPFWSIARAFYARIERHERLRPMFPQELDDAIRNQAEFLIQYFGGPPAYSARKGHPRLRMRHMQFRIGLQERNDWVDVMRAALEDAAIPEADRPAMMAYFEHAATVLMNDEH